MKIHAGFPFPAGGGQGITITGDAAEICYASGMECVCEAPVRFCSGVRVDAGFIGAFSFFNQQCSMRFVESIGRFGCSGRRWSPGAPSIRWSLSVRTWFFRIWTAGGTGRSIICMRIWSGWRKLSGIRKSMNLAPAPGLSSATMCGSAAGPQFCGV